MHNISRRAFLGTGVGVGGLTIIGCGRRPAVIPVATPIPTATTNVSPLAEGSVQANVLPYSYDAAKRLGIIFTNRSPDFDWLIEGEQVDEACTLPYEAFSANKHKRRIEITPEGRHFVRFEPRGAGGEGSVRYGLVNAAKEAKNGKIMPNIKAPLKPLTVYAQGAERTVNSISSSGLVERIEVPDLKWNWGTCTIGNPGRKLYYVESLQVAPKPGEDVDAIKNTFFYDMASRTWAEVRRERSVERARHYMEGNAYMLVPIELVAKPKPQVLSPETLKRAQDDARRQEELRRFQNVIVP